MYTVQMMFTAQNAVNMEIHLLTPIAERLTNEAEYIIITHDDFAEEANKLATHHRTHTGLKSSVLTLSEIYDDFSVGNIDIMAIRNAIRYAYLNNSDDNKPNMFVCLETQAMTIKIACQTTI